MVLVMGTCSAQLQDVTQPLTVSWADPERRAALKRKFAGEPEPERQVCGTPQTPILREPKCTRWQTPGVLSPMTQGPPVSDSKRKHTQACLAQVFFAKVPRAATEADVMALFVGLGAVEDVVLFKASGAQHHKVWRTLHVATRASRVQECPAAVCCISMCVQVTSAVQWPPGSCRHKRFSLTRLQGCGLATFADHQSAADAILALDGVYMWPNFHDPMVTEHLNQLRLHHSVGMA
jgi:hypothetical protein